MRRPRLGRLRAAGRRDVLIASEADAEHLFGITGDDFTEVARALVERFGVKTVVAVPRNRA